MVDTEISDTEISVMCDIARASGADLDRDKQQIAKRLVSEGLVEVAGKRKAITARDAVATAYDLTQKGQRLLADRGVGVNES